MGRVERDGGGGGLVNHHGQRDYGGLVRFQELFHFPKLAAGAQDIVHHDDLFARVGGQILAEAQRFGVVFALRPINLLARNASQTPKATGKPPVAGATMETSEATARSSELALSRRLNPTDSMRWYW